MSTQNLNGKVAVITGSSMGVGKAIAQELAACGVKVVLNGRDEQKLNQAAEEIRKAGGTVRICRADIREPNQCQQIINCAIKEYGQLDILVNNAAITSRGSVEEMAAENFKMLMDTNCIGSAYMCKCAIPELAKTKGQLIFISSAAGFRGFPYNSAYTISKLAQIGLADALRVEVYDQGIHVGIAYLSFIKNDPEKMILNVDGSWMYLPERTHVKRVTPKYVAGRVCRMIKKRQGHITISGLTKITSLVSRYMPWFANWYILKNRRKIEREYSHKVGAKVEDTAIKSKMV
ncbi:MAG: SDR family NAD(P)-dependent oxidoreductase [Bacteroidia bacterium]|nr:SDR family NAD(P)-dependent oxidoreductase [Bacteroidia bacterium]